MQKLRVIIGSLALVAVMSGGLLAPAGAAGPEVKGLIESERTISTFLLGEMKKLRQQVGEERGVVILKASCPKMEKFLFEIGSGRTKR